MPENSIRGMFNYRKANTRPEVDAENKLNAGNKRSRKSGRKPLQKKYNASGILDIGPFIWNNDSSTAKTRKKTTGQGPVKPRSTAGSKLFKLPSPMMTLRSGTKNAEHAVGDLEEIIYTDEEYKEQFRRFQNQRNDKPPNEDERVKTYQDAQKPKRKSKRLKPEKSEKDKKQAKGNKKSKRKKGTKHDKTAFDQINQLDTTLDENDVTGIQDVQLKSIHDVEHEPIQRSVTPKPRGKLNLWVRRNKKVSKQPLLNVALLDNDENLEKSSEPESEKTNSKQVGDLDGNTREARKQSRKRRAKRTRTTRNEEGSNASNDALEEEIDEECDVVDHGCDEEHLVSPRRNRFQLMKTRRKSKRSPSGKSKGAKSTMSLLRSTKSQHKQRKRRRSSLLAHGMIGAAMESVATAIIGDASSPHADRKIHHKYGLDCSGILLEDLLCDSRQQALRDIGHQPSSWNTRSPTTSHSNSIPFVPYGLPRHIANDYAGFIYLYLYVCVLGQLLTSLTMFLATQPLFYVTGLDGIAESPVAGVLGFFLAQTVVYSSLLLAKRTPLCQRYDGTIYLWFLGRRAFQARQLVFIGSTWMFISSVSLLLPRLLYHVLLVALPPSRAESSGGGTATRTGNLKQNDLIAPIMLTAIVLCVVLSFVFYTAGTQCFQWVQEERIQKELLFFIPRDEIVRNQRQTEKFVVLSGGILSLLIALVASAVNIWAVLGILVTLMLLYSIFTYHAWSKFVLHVINASQMETMVALFHDAESIGVLSPLAEKVSKGELILNNLKQLLRLKRKRSQVHERIDREGVTFHPAVVNRIGGKSRIGKEMQKIPIHLGVRLENLLTKAPSLEEQDNNSEWETADNWKKLIQAHVGRHFIVIYKNKTILVAIHEEATELDVLQALFEANRLRYYATRLNLKQKEDDSRDSSPKSRDSSPKSRKTSPKSRKTSSKSRKPSRFQCPSSSTSGLRWSAWVHYLQLLHETCPWIVDIENLGDTGVRDRWRIQDQDYFLDA